MQRIFHQLSLTGPNGIIVMFFILIASSAIIVEVASMLTRHS